MPEFLFDQMHKFESLIFVDLALELDYLFHFQQEY